MGFINLLKEEDFSMNEYFEKKFEDDNSNRKIHSTPIDNVVEKLDQMKDEIKKQIEEAEAATENVDPAENLHPTEEDEYDVETSIDMILKKVEPGMRNIMKDNTSLSDENLNYLMDFLISLAKNGLEKEFKMAEVSYMTEDEINETVSEFLIEFEKEHAKQCNLSESINKESAILIPEEEIKIVDDSSTIEDVVSKVAVAANLASDDDIKNNKIQPGLIFDVDENGTMRPIEENEPVALIDNISIISKFPKIGTIQEIVRNLGLDIEMIPYAEEFIFCLLYKDGKQIDKRFIVDYNGNYMNNIPKIFLLNGKYADESEIIHINDHNNLLNFIKGINVIQSNPVVTDEQRYIGRYIINYGNQMIPENDYKSFNFNCLKVIDGVIRPEVFTTEGEVGFKILSYKSPNEWILISDKSVPTRFGAIESGNNTIYIHSNGYNENGTLNVNLSRTN